MVNSVTMGLPAFTPPGPRGCSCLTFWYTMCRNCGWAFSRTSSPTSEGSSDSGLLWSSTSSCCTMASKASAYCQSFCICMASVRALSIFCFKAVKSIQPTWPAMAHYFSGGCSSRERSTFSVLIGDPSTASKGSGGVQVGHQKCCNSIPLAL